MITYEEKALLHNVAEIVPVEGGAVRLQRVPEAMRIKLNEGAQERCLAAANCEIRFVAEGPVRLTLSAPNGGGYSIWWGEYDARQRGELSAEPTTLDIGGEALPAGSLRNLARHVPGKHVFSPAVCRVRLSATPIHLHGIEGDAVRPPRAEELPALRYLAYGTSITQGGCATHPHLTYVAQTAYHLKADPINLGMSGACHCEKEFGDFIGGRKDWDVATLALSVNMVGAGFTPEEFRERVEYVVNTVAGADTTRPVLCITLWPYFGDLGDPFLPQSAKAPSETFRQILREVVADCPHPNVHVAEGPELLTRWDGLTTDLIHPGDFGMAEMGRNVAARLKALLAK